MRETPTLIKLSLGLNIGGTFDKKGIYYLCSVHFHKLMNDALRFMDSKAKNKEQTPIDWNRKWRKKTAGHRARLSVIEEPPTKKFKTTLSRTYLNVNRNIFVQTYKLSFCCHIFFRSLLSYSSLAMVKRSTAGYQRSTTKKSFASVRAFLR